MYLSFCQIFVHLTLDINNLIKLDKMLTVNHSNNISKQKFIKIYEKILEIERNASDNYVNFSNYQQKTVFFKNINCDTSFNKKFGCIENKLQTNYITNNTNNIKKHENKRIKDKCIDFLENKKIDCQVNKKIRVLNRTKNISNSSFKYLKIFNKIK